MLIIIWLNKQPSPPKTVRRAELYNKKESQITPTLSSVPPNTHTPIISQLTNKQSIISSIFKQIMFFA